MTASGRDFCCPERDQYGECGHGPFPEADLRPYLDEVREAVRALVAETGVPEEALRPAKPHNENCSPWCEGDHPPAPSDCGRPCGEFVIHVELGVAYDPPLRRRAYCGLVPGHPGECRP